MKLESEYLLHAAAMLTHSASDGVSAANSVNKYGGTPEAIEGASKGLHAASGAVSLLYGMGIEGGAQLGSSISDSHFVTALCLVLAAVAFLRLGFATQDREQNAPRYGRIDRTHARTEEPDYRQNRRGA